MKILERRTSIGRHSSQSLQNINELPPRPDSLRYSLFLLGIFMGNHLLYRRHIISANKYQMVGPDFCHPIRIVLPTLLVRLYFI